MQQMNQHLNLAQGDVVVVKAGEEDHVLSADEILWREAANFDVICSVRELVPFGWEEHEPVGMSLASRKTLKIGAIVLLQQR
mmetsp:Transcript_41505/g.76696  ORF Transcript_41505/g.76696 Transcript_41505/m.76696 type:complete len:82 (+) Transcript_41505:541-786(+)